MQQLWAITGANGFIGRALRADLEATGIAVRGLSRANSSDVQGDVRDREVVRALVRGAEVVVHLAAYVHRGETGQAAERENWSVNVDGAQALIDVVADEASKPFTILVSSASVYGPVQGIIDESVQCRPVTPYGRSKLEAERRFLGAVQRGSIRGAVLRPAMTFGPGDTGNLKRLIRMVELRLVPLPRRGAVRKSIVPVGSVVQAIRAIAERRESNSGETFNVAGATLTLREIVETVANTLHVKPLITPMPAGIARTVAVVADRISSRSFTQLVDAYVSDVVLSDTRLQSRTSYTPPTDVREALTATAASESTRRK